MESDDDVVIIGERELDEIFDRALNTARKVSGDITIIKGIIKSFGPSWESDVSSKRIGDEIVKSKNVIVEEHKKLNKEGGELAVAAYSNQEKYVKYLNLEKRYTELAKSYDISKFEEARDELNDILKKRDENIKSIEELKSRFKETLTSTREYLAGTTNSLNDTVNTLGPKIERMVIEVGNLETSGACDVKSITIDLEREKNQLINLFSSTDRSMKSSVDVILNNILSVDSKKQLISDYIKFNDHIPTDLTIDNIVEKSEELKKIITTEYKFMKVWRERTFKSLFVSFYNGEMAGKHITDRIIAVFNNVKCEELTPQSLENYKEAVNTIFPNEPVNNYESITDRVAEYDHNAMLEIKMKGPTGTTPKVAYSTLDPKSLLQFTTKYNMKKILNAQEMSTFQSVTYIDDGDDGSAILWSPEREFKEDEDHIVFEGDGKIDVIDAVGNVDTVVDEDAMVGIDWETDYNLPSGSRLKKYARFIYHRMTELNNRHGVINVVRKITGNSVTDVKNNVEVMKYILDDIIPVVMNHTEVVLIPVDVGTADKAAKTKAYEGDHKEMKHLFNGLTIDTTSIPSVDNSGNTFGDVESQYTGLYRPWDGKKFKEHFLNLATLIDEQNDDTAHVVKRIVHSFIENMISKEDDTYVDLNTSMEYDNVLDEWLAGLMLTVYKGLLDGAYDEGISVNFINIFSLPNVSEVSRLLDLTIVDTKSFYETEYLQKIYMMMNIYKHFFPPYVFSEYKITFKTYIECENELANDMENDIAMYSYFYNNGEEAESGIVEEVVHEMETTPVQMFSGWEDYDNRTKDNNADTKELLKKYLRSKGITRAKNSKGVMKNLDELNDHAALRKAAKVEMSKEFGEVASTVRSQVPDHSTDVDAPYFANKAAIDKVKKADSDLLKNYVLWYKPELWDDSFTTLDPMKKAAKRVLEMLISGELSVNRYENNPTPTPVPAPVEELEPIQEEQPSSATFNYDELSDDEKAIMNAISNAGDENEPFVAFGERGNTYFIDDWNKPENVAATGEIKQLLKKPSNWTPESNSEAAVVLAQGLYGYIAGKSTGGIIDKNGLKKLLTEIGLTPTTDVVDNLRKLAEYYVNNT